MEEAGSSENNPNTQKTEEENFVKSEELSSENNTPRDFSDSSPNLDDLKERPKILSEEYTLPKNQSKYFQKVLMENVKRSPSIYDLNSSTSTGVLNQFSNSFTINRMSNNLSFLQPKPNDPVRMSQDEMLLTKLKILERESKERKIMDELITTQKVEYTSKGLPLTSVVLMKIMQNFDSFSPVNDGFAQKVIKSIKMAIEKNMTDFEYLSYWIGNFSVILCIIKQEYPITEETITEDKCKKITDRKKIATIVKDDSFFGFSVFLESLMNEQEMKIESDISEFKDSIEVLLYQTYACLLMNMYSTLLKIIEKCMFSSENDKENTKLIILLFEKYYQLMIQNSFLKDIINSFYDQVFYFIENHILNIFMENQKYHTMGYSILLKLNTGVLTDWIFNKKIQISNPNLELIKEITMILMVNKDMFLEDEFLNETCPSITKKEIAIFISSYHPDDYDPYADISPQLLKKYPKETNIEPRNEFVIFEFKIKNFVELNSWRMIDVPINLLDFEEELKSPRRSSIKMEVSTD